MWPTKMPEKAKNIIDAAELPVIGTFADDPTTAIR
jgi:hypothetical protein